MTKFIFKDIMIVNIYQTQERVDHNLFINDKREIYSAIPALVKLSYNFPEYLSQFQMYYITNLNVYLFNACSLKFEMTLKLYR